jgi:hypothetical protein
VVSVVVVLDVPRVAPVRPLVVPESIRLEESVPVVPIVLLRVVSVPIVPLRVVFVPVVLEPVVLEPVVPVALLPV